MKATKNIIISLSLAALASCNTHSKVGQSEIKVYHGEDILSGDKNEVAFLYNPKAQRFCTGVFVKDDTALTTAVCAQGILDAGAEREVFLGRVTKGLSGTEVTAVAKATSVKFSNPGNGEGTRGLAVVRFPKGSSQKLATLHTWAEYDKSSGTQYPSILKRPTLVGYGRPDSNASDEGLALVSMDLNKIGLREKQNQAYCGVGFNIKRHRDMISCNLVNGSVGDQGAPLYSEDGKVVGLFAFNDDPSIFEVWFPNGDPLSGATRNAEFLKAEGLLP